MNGPPRVLKLAILALGGQGGGVLTNWIEQTARSRGWLVQATSVAGVAQRTGATIYYVEMAEDRGRAPVFALAPAPGDVDVLIGAELMEAGRAIQRGFVTPDRTLLIASTHRAYATAEKIAPGDGRADPAAVRRAAGQAARAVLMADFEALARAEGSVISASLLGALAASGALPFPREAFEATVRASGRGVAASLAAFDAAWARVAEGEGPAAEPVRAESARAESARPEPARPEPARPVGPRGAPEAWAALEARAAALPPPAAEMARAGLRKVVDFQDLAYGAEYLDLVEGFRALDDSGAGWRLTEAAAKYVAVSMAYDDVIRVADLKTRPERFERIRREMKLRDGQVMTLTEYMHPRAAEVVGLLPARLGARVEARPGLFGWIDRRVSRGRRVRSADAPWFVALFLVAGLRRFRRRLRRHAVETAHRDAWLDLARGAARRDRALAAEILACRRLIKGYSDTHARGLSKFDRVLAALPLIEGRSDAADWLRRLREAALRDEPGEALDGAVRTVESFAKAAA